MFSEHNISSVFNLQVIFNNTTQRQFLKTKHNRNVLLSANYHKFNFNIQQTLTSCHTLVIQQTI